jgi:hypothetical protein
MVPKLESRAIKAVASDATAAMTVVGVTRTAVRQLGVSAAGGDPALATVVDIARTSRA